MPPKYVTCPETAHLELLELDYHPLGILVDGCSRFQPGCELTCSRSCAALLDRRMRSRGKPELPLLASLSVGDETQHALDLDTVFAQQREQEQEREQEPPRRES